jgi:hypothetical protein
MRLWRIRLPEAIKILSLETSFYKIRIPEIKSVSFSLLHKASQLIFGINYPEFHQQRGYARNNKVAQGQKI